MNGIRTARGLTIIDVLATLLALAMLLAIVVPALARGQNDSQISVSLNNLNQINAALAAYANDFNGRQPSAIVDDFSTYGPNGTTAVSNYAQVHGTAHPPLILGSCAASGGGPTTWAYYFPPDSPTPGNYIVLVPIEFVGSNRFGFFRLMNTRMLHDYVGSGFYRSVFYAPNDAMAYSVTEPWYDHPCEFAFEAQGSGSQPYSSYCFSPAAMFDPQVLRGPNAGGYVDPYSIATGFRSPTVSQAQFPALKTRILEHHWNQNPPANRCNPAFTVGNYDNCQPYFFNHGTASAPATLFFDGSTRTLPNSEVVDGDSLLIQQTGQGLWHRGTPMGSMGYYSEYGVNAIIVNHHILTIDGIRGRDTLGPIP